MPRQGCRAKVLGKKREGRGEELESGQTVKTRGAVEGFLKPFAFRLMAALNHLRASYINVPFGVLTSSLKYPCLTLFRRRSNCFYGHMFH